MKLENNYWIDRNNNKWNCNLFTEEEAIKYSSNCRYCSDCTNCIDCIDCRYCSNCSNCRYCSDCIDCSNCIDCRYCGNCSNCRYCSDCIDCSNCIDCRYCGNCSNCSNCGYCSDFKINPKKIVSDFIGSRKSQTCIYWTSKEDMLIICGCFKGNLEEFKIAVKTIHLGTIYYDEYMKFINKVEKYIGD